MLDVFVQGPFNFVVEKEHTFKTSTVALTVAFTCMMVRNIHILYLRASNKYCDDMLHLNAYFVKYFIIYFDTVSECV